MQSPSHMKISGHRRAITCDYLNATTLLIQFSLVENAPQENFLFNVRVYAPNVKIGGF